MMTGWSCTEQSKFYFQPLLLNSDAKVVWRRSAKTFKDTHHQKTYKAQTHMKSKFLALPPPTHPYPPPCFRIGGAEDNFI